MWFKVDDHFAVHPKVFAAGNPAIGLWVRAGAWSAYELTDGYVSSGAVEMLGTVTLANRLVSCGLWIPDGDGWRFHEWEQWQPTRADIEARRKARAERVRRWRQDHLK